ncbi:hypothetical protein KPL74_08815 [Bacillus sp. NP157]|nr:hypothetical protein KPL74_08815 [Bacillus sp. NP157]
MQHLSAYLLEIPDLPDLEARALHSRVIEAVDEWLTRKGVGDLTAGESMFVSKNQGREGTVRQSFFANEQGELREIMLEEPTHDGHVFRTALRVVRSALRVVVYLTLAARNVDSIIRPGFVVPRCPEIIHKIRDLRDDWRLGDTKLGPAGVVEVDEEADGIALAERIISQRRSIPLVAVSLIDGNEQWAGLSKLLARDLSALATVVRVSEEAGWTLTEELGRKFSCYGGAVRLYWPALKGTGDGRVSGRVWTPDQLDSMDWNGEGMERLRSQLRMTVMSAAALGVEPPFEIREIRSYRARVRLRELEARGQEAADELALAQEFFNENESLREEIRALHQVIAQMKGGYEAPVDAAPEDADAGEVSTGDTPSPASGDIRFYKKKYATPGFDVMVPIGDCGHNTWESAFKADKAKKGIARLEGIENWQQLHHCAKCEGGGVWRVKW